jgi:hypothetical protein
MLDGTHSSVEKQDPNVSENSWNRAEDFKFHNTYQGDEFYQLASKSRLARSLSMYTQELTELTIHAECYTPAKLGTK